MAKCLPLSPQMLKGWCSPHGPVTLSLPPSPSLWNWKRRQSRREAMRVKGAAIWSRGRTFHSPFPFLWMEINKWNFIPYAAMTFIYFNARGHLVEQNNYSYSWEWLFFSLPFSLFLKRQKSWEIHQNEVSNLNLTISVYLGHRNSLPCCLRCVVWKRKGTCWNY